MGPRSLLAVCLRALADAVLAGASPARLNIPYDLVRKLWKELLPRYAK